MESYNIIKLEEKDMKEMNALFQIVQLANNEKQKGRCLTFDRIKELVNGRMVFVNVPKGNYITTEKRDAKKVYYVLSGSFLKMRGSKSGANNVLAREKVPQFLGIDKVIYPDRCVYPDTLALDDCGVLEIDASYFVTSLHENAELAFEIVQILCGRLIQASQRSERILFCTATEKLMIYIIQYWYEYYSGRKQCVLKIKNEFIADNIGVSIRTLYRAIEGLKKQNLIKIVKGNIVVTEEQIQVMKSQVEV